MKKLLLALFFLALATSADATTCFWVGGTGSWSTTNGVSWSSASGGSVSTCAATGGVPKQAGDVATFDGSSGGGTVTVDSTMNGTTINTITMGAFTGTLDFSVNNPSMTLGASGAGAFNVSGSGTRVLKLGSGTFTCKAASNNCFDATTNTGLTFTGGTATISVVSPGLGTSAAFNFNGTNWSGNTITVQSRTDSSTVSLNGTVTIGTVNVTGPAAIQLTTGTTTTITNAISWAGTSSGQINIYTNSFGNNTQATLAVAAGSTLNWAALRAIAVTGTTVPATNSFDFGTNSGVTITSPSGGGGHIIGG